MRTWTENDETHLELDDYPSDKVGWVLDTISIQGRYYDAPSGQDPQNSWKWAYANANWTAVMRVLKRSETK